jgi:hypothetical protein
MYVPSYEEYEQFTLAKERLAKEYQESLQESPAAFDEVIDQIVTQQFDTWSQLLLKIANRDDYLDAAIELRELMRVHTLRVADTQAQRELTKPV